MEQMTSICDMVGQYMQKKEEDRRIAEDQAAKDRYWKIPICYDDDEDYTIAITPVLSTEEPVDSLIMKDEHLDAILATESDKVIKSSVENLVLTPSESEGIPDSMCDVPLCNNSTPLKAFKEHSEIVVDFSDDSTSSDGDSPYGEDIDNVNASPPDYELVSLEVVENVTPEDGEIEDDVLRENLSKINLLIAKIKELKDNPPLSSSFVTKSFSTSLNFFTEETNTFDNSLPESETFCFNLEKISSGSTTTRSDLFLPDYETFYDHIKEKSSGSTTTHADFSQYDSFIFDLSIDSFPPADRSDFYHEEFADELAHIISPPEYDCFYFNSEPDPGELTSIVDSGIRENISSTTNVNLPFEDAQSPLLAFVVWIFLPFLTYPVTPPYLLSCGNEDTIFDPGISIYHSFMPAWSDNIRQKKEEKEKQIAEEQASKDRYWKIPICYDDDEDYTIAITPVSSTKEPVNSLSMGDEHLDTIPATESDEVIKSSVENLVPIPKHSEIVINFNDDSTSSDDDSPYGEDIDYVDASPPDAEIVSSEVVEIVIPEVGGIDTDILLTIKDDILHNPVPSSDFVTKSPSTFPNSFLEETNTFDNSLTESETFRFNLEEISSGSTTTRSDYSLPDYEAFYLDDDHIEEISSGSTTTHSEFSLSKYDSFIFDLSINPFPPADRSDLYHEEFACELAHIISPPEYDCFCFKNEPELGESTMDVVGDIYPTRESRVHVPNVLPTHPTLNLDFILLSEPLFAYIVWIFLPFLTYPVTPSYFLSCGNEDTIFDPGISVYHSFIPGVSHRSGTFMKFNVYPNHLNESPMEILSSTCSPMDQ
ncbi:hypothetical protein Tco_0272932 [Tanacetum coccineum]